MMLLTKELRKKLPPLYSTDGNPNAKCIVKFFALDSNWTWYAFEFDGEDTFFGFVEGYEREWGYFSLRELQSLKWHGVPRVERDKFYVSQTKAELGQFTGAQV